MSIRKVSLLILAAILVAVPLFSVACSDDDALSASFRATPTSGPAPLEVTFTSTSTADESDDIVSYAWDFDGDGTVDDTVTTDNVKWTYEEEGTYDVALTVTTTGGDTDTVTETGFVIVGSFVADFSANVETVTFAAAGGTPTAIQFTDASVSDETITAWAWDFDGDGTVDSNLQNPTHTYAGAVNRYDVSLTITSSEGTKTRTKEGFIIVHADSYDAVSLKLNYPMATGQTASKPADKFAELADTYSGGTVDVVVYGGGAALYGYGYDMPAVAAGDIDIAWMSPFFLRNVSPCLDPFGGIPNLVITYQQARVILDTPVTAMVDGAVQAALGSKVLGWFESILGGLMAGKQDMGSTFVKDVWAGKKFGGLYEGAMAPEQAYAGLEELVVGGLNEITEAALGNYDVSGTSWDHYAETGLIDYFPHAMVTVNFSPMVALMNLTKLNSLPTNTQDLITKVIVPECQDYARAIALQDHAEVLKVMAETCDSLNIQTPVQGKAVYDNMVAEGWTPMTDRITAFQEGFAGLGAQIFGILSLTVSQAPQWDQDFLDMLEYAGLTPPAL
ncbi:PKD domain-containing protein [Chloroflexota bacterium]